MSDYQDEAPAQSKADADRAEAKRQADNRAAAQRLAAGQQGKYNPNNDYGANDQWDSRDNPNPNAAAAKSDEVQRQADPNQRQQQSFGKGARPTRVSTSAAALQQSFQAFSDASMLAFKDVNKLAADADNAVTDGNIAGAQDIIKQIRAVTATHIEALRIPVDVPTGGLHDNSGLSGGRVDHTADNLHDYNAGRINPVSQY